MGILTELVEKFLCHVFCVSSPRYSFFGSFHSSVFGVVYPFYNATFSKYFSVWEAVILYSFYSGV